MEAKNDSLLAKWWWKFYNDKNGLWRRALVGKYGEDCFNVLRNAWKHRTSFTVSPVVKSVISISDECYNKSCSRIHFKWTLGNGQSAEFWIDNWHRLGVLKDSLSLMFNRAYHKAANVAYVKRLVGSSAWGDLLDMNLPFTTDERTQFERLAQLVSEIILQDKEDKLEWSTSNTSLTSAAVYNLLISSSCS